MQREEGQKSYYILTYQARKPEKIFRKTGDYQYFLRLIRRFRDQFEVNIICFSLLPETLYLVIRAPDLGCISLFFEEVIDAYRNFFSSRYDEKDFNQPWQYSIKSIEQDLDLHWFIKFVEFTPVHAQICDNPIIYPWSSCSFRVLNRGDEFNVLNY